MRIPSKVKALGLDFNVQENSDVSKAGDTFGSVHYSSQSLFIDPQLNQQMKEQTFLHELLHVCIFSSGYHKLLDNKDYKATEEDIICALEGPLYAILKDNVLHFDDPTN